MAHLGLRPRRHEPPLHFLSLVYRPPGTILELALLCPLVERRGEHDSIRPQFSIRYVCLNSVAVVAVVMLLSHSGRPRVRVSEVEETVAEARQISEGNGEVREEGSVEAVVVVAATFRTFTLHRFLGKECFHSSYCSSGILVKSTVLTFPRPHYAPAVDDTVTEVENVIVKASAGKKSPNDAFMPQRPGFGTQGRKVMLWANSFPLVFQGDIQLHRYSVDVLPDDERSRVPTGQKVKRVIQLLLEDHFPDKKPGIASDFKSNLISMTKLELSDKGYRVPYRGDYEDEYVIGAPSYRVRLQSTGTLYVSELVNYLRSTDAGASLRSKDEITQGFNIVMGHTPKAAIGISSIGSSKHFQLATSEKRDLGAGLTALQGFFFSVRAATGRVIVNVQVKNAAFYDEGPLEWLMRAYLNKNGPAKAKLANFVKRLRVNVTHIKKRNKKGQVIPRVKQIAGLATPDDGHGDPNPPRVREFGSGPKDVLFYLAGPNEGNGDKAESSKKKGKRTAKAGPEPPVSGGIYISVYDFFQQSKLSRFQRSDTGILNASKPTKLPSKIPNFPLSMSVLVSAHRTSLHRYVMCFLAKPRGVN